MWLYIENVIIIIIIIYYFYFPFVCGGFFNQLSRRLTESCRMVWISMVHNIHRHTYQFIIAAMGKILSSQWFEKKKKLKRIHWGVKNVCWLYFSCQMHCCRVDVAVVRDAVEEDKLLINCSFIREKVCEAIKRRYRLRTE